MMNTTALVYLIAEMTTTSSEFLPSRQKYEPNYFWNLNYANYSRD